MLNLALRWLCAVALVLPFPNSFIDNAMAQPREDRIAEVCRILSNRQEEGLRRWQQAYRGHANNAHLAVGRTLHARAIVAEQEALGLFCTQRTVNAVRAECDRLTGLDVGPTRGRFTPWQTLDASRAYGYCKIAALAAAGTGAPDPISAAQSNRAFYSVRARLIHEYGLATLQGAGPIASTGYAFSTVTAEPRHVADLAYGCFFKDLMGLSAVTGTRYSNCRDYYNQTRDPAAALEIAREYLEEPRTYVLTPRQVRGYLQTAAAAGLNTADEERQLAEVERTRAAAAVRRDDEAATALLVIAGVVAIAACAATNCLGGGADRRNRAPQAPSTQSRPAFDPGGDPSGRYSPPPPPPSPARPDTSVGCIWGDRAYGTC